MQLAADAADQGVDRARVAVRRAPDGGGQFLAADHPPLRKNQGGQQVELTAGQAGGFFRRGVLDAPRAEVYPPWAKAVGADRSRPAAPGQVADTGRELAE